MEDSLEIWPSVSKTIAPLDTGQLKGLDPEDLHPNSASATGILVFICQRWPLATVSKSTQYSFPFSWGKHPIFPGLPSLPCSQAISLRWGWCSWFQGRACEHLTCEQLQLKYCNLWTWWMNEIKKLILLCHIRSHARVYTSFCVDCSGSLHLWFRFVGWGVQMPRKLGPYPASP